MRRVTLEELTEWLRRQRAGIDRIAVLTGAGISAESGIPTFRGNDRLWRGQEPAELFLPATLFANPERSWQFYDELRVLTAGCMPNAGHAALAELGRHVPVAVATQNIDGLHQRAGSASVLELHGTLWRLRCTACRYRRDDRQTPLPTLPPHCPACGALLRPDIVFYTEMLPEAALSGAARAAQACALMLVVGTSGVVYPAAGLPQLAAARGATVVEVNPEETALSAEMEFTLRATATVALPAISRALIAG